MKISIKKCHECGAMPFGRRPVKLWPFEGRWYCREHYRDPLGWHEQREEVARAIRSMAEFDEAMRRVERTYGLFLTKVGKTSWRGFIEECAGLAGWSLSVGDRRTFVYYFSRAVWAWELSEEA